MHALVVDDDPVCRLHAATVLTRLGFEVHSAANVSDACARQSALPDLAVALVDWHLQADNGLAVIRALRGREQTHRTCICLYTGEGARSVWNDAIAAGTNAVLRKPIDRDELAFALTRLGAI